MVFTCLVPAYPGCPGKTPLNGCSVVVVVAVFVFEYIRKKVIAAKS